MGDNKCIEIDDVYYEIPVSPEAVDNLLYIHNVDAFADEFHGVMSQICTAESHDGDASVSPCCGHAMEVADALRINHNCEPVTVDTTTLAPKMVELVEKAL